MKLEHDKYSIFSFTGDIIDSDTGQKQTISNFRFVSHVSNAKRRYELIVQTDGSDNTVTLYADTSDWAEDIYNWNIAVFQGSDPVPMTTQDFALEVYAGATHANA